MTARNSPGRSYQKSKKMFKIKKVRPLFTGVITTATKYKDVMTTNGGLIIDTTKMEGSLNPYQTVVAVGDMVRGLSVGDIVKINFNRYARAKHIPGKIEDNVQSDNLVVTYEIPMVPIDGQEYLFIQHNDIEYVVEDYEVDEGGLLQ